MATKSFQEICVEYAHQLGKGLPLTAPEMCNAVIMYLNAQITEMQGITTALQTAVSEAESSATEAINKADDVSETVNALPKVPTPTTSDNGKVIGVQSGAYALVEQSGGESPANMVTTDTPQIITENKGSEANYYTNGIITVGNYSNSDLNAFVNGEDPADWDNSEVVIGNNSITVSDYYNGGTDKEYVEMSTFRPSGAEGFTDYDNEVVSYRKFGIYVKKYLDDTEEKTDRYYLGFPFKSGMIAVESDIPDLSAPASVAYEQATGATITYGTINAKELVLPIIAGDNVTIDSDSSGTHLQIGLENVAVLDSNKTLAIPIPANYSGFGIRVDKVATSNFVGITNSALYFYLNEVNGTYITCNQTVNGVYNLILPAKNATIATLDDVPDLHNYNGYINVINGTAGSGIAVHDTAKASPYTKYGYDKIETYGNSNALQYTLNIPNKNGTIATLDDIPSSSGGKLYNHYISCTVTGIGIASSLNINFNFISSSATVIEQLYRLSSAIKNRFLSCDGDLGYSVDGDDAIPIYITSDGSRILMGYITQGSNNKGEVSLDSLDTFDFSDSVSEI